MCKSQFNLDNLTRVDNGPTEENSTKNKKYLHNCSVEVVANP